VAPEAERRREHEQPSKRGGRRLCEQASETETATARDRAAVPLNQGEPRVARAGASGSSAVREQDDHAAMEEVRVWEVRVLVFSFHRFFG
jgi:hypothetical protein